MSQWTHVAGIIRVDGLGHVMGLSPEREIRTLEAIMGEPASYDSPREVWDRTTLPCGSEGSIQYDVRITAKSTGLSRGHIAIWGDLRDYDDVKEITSWFEGILSQFKPGPGKFFSTRDAVMSIDVEYSGKRVILGWNEGKLVGEEIKVKV